MKRILQYVLLPLSVLLTSCQFDHLHYETSLLAMVRIDVDWSQTNLTPNGVSAYVYDASGALYTQKLSSNPNVVFVSLPVGNYTVVLHNDEISYIGGVELREMKRLESAAIYATERRGKPSIEVRGDDDLPFINEPDDVAAYTLRDVEVTQDDVEYHYDKPNISDYEQQITHIYKATPKHIVHRSRVIAHISGLEYATGAPKATLRGMSGGYGFDKQSTTDGSVMEEFTVNTRVSKADDSEEDTIYVDYNTFGMHESDLEGHCYYLDIRFNLIDGSYKDYHIDVTDDIRTEVTERRNLHIVEVRLDPLPEVDGGDPPAGGDADGSFEPSLDDWIDVEVDLPM